MWFESSIVEATRDAFPEWMAFLFAIFSYFGSVWFVAPAVVLAFWFGDRYQFAPWLAIVMGCYAIMVGAKGALSVDRPGVDPAIPPESLPLPLEVLYAPLVEVSTTTFPSGHAMAGTVIWTMIALETSVGTTRQRLAVAAAMIVAISFSRIAVGLHYPIDVGAGVLIALAFLVVALVFIDRLSGKDPRSAGTVAFALVVVIGLVSFAVGGRVDALALSGGALGGLIAWHYASPPQHPWPRSLETLKTVFVGLAILGAVALVLTFIELEAVWFVVGFVGGVIVVGMPALYTPSLPTRSTDQVPG